MSFHSNESGNSAIHPAAYVTASDPASPDTTVTADNKLWIDTTTGTTFATGWLLKIRATSNTVWTTILDLSTSLGSFVTKATLTTLGDIFYASSANTPARLAGNTTTTKKFLRSTGAAGVATAPAWDTVVENDVGASTNDAGNTGTAITIDWSLARTQKITATGNATVTHSNMVAGIVYTLEYHTGAGSFTGAFASTNWAAASAPTLTVTASKLDIFTFYKTIGGTIEGGVFGQEFAP